MAEHETYDNYSSFSIHGLTSEMLVVLEMREDKKTCIYI